MPVSNPVPYYVTAAVSAVGLLATFYAHKRYQEKRRNKLPEEWVHVGHLKRLYAYPIKSCAPIVLNQAECSIMGLRDGWLRDRILMVVEAPENNFVTARVYPELLKISCSIKKAILTLKHPNMQPIEVNLAEVMVTHKLIQTVVWFTPVTVYDCGQEVNDWFTKCLNHEGNNFRLVYYASQNSRPVVGMPKIFDKCRDTDAGALVDELAYNIINEASVEELNTRLKDTKVTESNFRPNFLLSGAAAYDEDNWKFVKIGENIFEVIKPCTRCTLTTIDPETGVRNKNMEPLGTLRSYRLSVDPEMLKVTGESPRLGTQMALRSGPGGIVSLNDPIYVAY
ncbi:unnamed protein product [Arctia plantaginis]|uniref:MOSC domain-containing protein n=1 Tax=Arctia plantaginis TaxID=874455 RepID=A0A8S1AUI6_ARCPL|nr:unnamed protein product [Arctia plantaginis]